MRAEALARAVAASSRSSALLPADVATVLDVRPIVEGAEGGRRLCVTLAIGDERYWYLWPEHGCIEQTLPLNAPEGIARAAHVVLANVAELLEAADLGLARALEQRLLVRTSSPPPAP